MCINVPIRNQAMSVHPPVHQSSTDRPLVPFDGFIHKSQHIYWNNEQDVNDFGTENCIILFYC